MSYPTPYYSRVQARRSSGSARPASSMRAVPYGQQDSNDFMSDLDYSSLISGGLGLAGNYINMSNQGLGLQAPNPTQLSATGQPIYGAGTNFNEAFKVKPQGATGGEILSSAGQGAAAGAAAGPWGAAIGAVGGATVAIIGGEKRKNKQQREKDKGLTASAQSQDQYNRRSRTFDQTQMALDSYYQRMNIDDQIYNLYK